MTQAQATSCTYKTCGNTTTDPSGYCHHHRAMHAAPTNPRFARAVPDAAISAKLRGLDTDFDQVAGDHLTAGLARFFEGEISNEAAGGAAPATLDSAMDSFSQGGPDVFSMVGDDDYEHFESMVAAAGGGAELRDVMNTESGGYNYPAYEPAPEPEPFDYDAVRFTVSCGNCGSEHELGGRVAYAARCLDHPEHKDVSVQFADPRIAALGVPVNDGFNAHDVAQFLTEAASADDRRPRMGTETDLRTWNQAHGQSYFDAAAKKWHGARFGSTGKYGLFTESVRAPGGEREYALKAVLNDGSVVKLADATSSSNATNEMRRYERFAADYSRSVNA